MEERMQIIQAAGNSKIQIGVIPGHYATNHSHINYYVDITSLKTGYKMAKEPQRHWQPSMFQHISTLSYALKAQRSSVPFSLKALAKAA